MVERCFAASLLVVLLAAGVPVHAEEAGEGTTARVAASERYRAGRVHRFALGGGYRA